MAEIITSTGTVGTDFYRSEGRAYLTEGEVVGSGQVLESFQQLRGEALIRGRRRWVLKAVVENEALSNLAGSLLEVDIPLSVIEENSGRHLIILAENIHNSDVPEWHEVYNYWRRPYTKSIDPISCIDLVKQQFQLTTKVSLEDAEDLAEIWRPFGWTQNGVIKFIQDPSENIWVSAVRDTTSGRLVSACQGESITLGGQVFVESTEFGTKPGFEGKGLCTAAVVGLNAQILQNTFDTNGQLPLIYSELSMTTRSDVVARKSGMTIPLVEGQINLEKPTQVLSRNVSVLDGHDPNDLNLEELGNQAEYFREAYGGTFPYWRNFIMGVLSKEAIEKYYLESKCREILNYYD